MIRAAAVIAVSLLVLTGCGSAASHPSATKTPGPVGFGPVPSWSSGPSGPSGYTGAGGPYNTGPTGVACTGSTGPCYTSSATSPGPVYYSGSTPNGCLVSYGLCISVGSLSAGVFDSQPLHTDLGFRCRVAVTNGQPGSGGFISVPGGGFTPDPHSDVTISYPLGSPAGPTNFGFSFKARAGRWFPVGHDWVSPDANRYGYPDQTGIHVIKVADGSDTVLGKGRTWRLLVLDNTGAYAAEGTATLGLWFLPLAGTARQVTSEGFWTVASTNTAYGLQAPSVPSGANDPVLRLDLGSGAVRTWWATAPMGVQPLAVGPDDGSLIMSISTQYNKSYFDLRRMPQSEQQVSLFYGPYGYVANLPVVVDTHGVWLSFNNADKAIWFVSAQDMWPVSKAPAMLASSCD